MSRPLRVTYPGAWYHIMNRGAAKQLIFNDIDHYKMFIQLLGELHERFQVRIHAYCLMPNHYHILLQTPLANISCAMRHLDSLYTRRYNLSQKRDGPLLRGRFKSILVDDENYLLHLSRYIHLNPVVANIVAHAEDYLWSSYRAYLNKKLKPDWLLTREILDRFGSNEKIYKYQIFIAEGVDNEISVFYKKIKLMPILGCKAFIKNIVEKYIKNKEISPEIPERKYLKPIFSFEQIKLVVIRHYKINEIDLKHVKRKAGNKPRQVAIYLACKWSGQKYKIIANEFTNITIAGVAKIFQRITKETTTDSALNEEIILLEKHLMSFVQT